MTGTLAETPESRAKELFRKMKDLQDESDRLEGDRAEIETRLEDIRSIQKDLAGTICMNGYKHDIYELTEFEMKETTEVDTHRLKEEYPHVFSRANPHLSKTQIADCLIDINGGRAEVESKIQKTRPDLFNDLAKVTKTDLKKAVSRDEWERLRDAGVIKTVLTPTGNPRLVLRGFKQALESQRRRRSLPKHSEEGEEE